LGIRLISCLPKYFSLEINPLTLYAVLKRILRWRIFLALAVVPVVIIAGALLLAYVQGATRYNPDYFTGEYLERYQTPNLLLNDLEQALQTGDARLLAAVQGTHPAAQSLVPQPHMVFSSIYNKREGPYVLYLFYDTVTYHRHMAYFKEMDGRYVVVPQGLYYYFDSGRWDDVFIPPALFWWSILVLTTGAGLLYIKLADMRQRMYQGRG
jgi:hypothetical protein